jgi:hypothetical protein
MACNGTALLTLLLPKFAKKCPVHHVMAGTRVFKVVHDKYDVTNTNSGIRARNFIALGAKVCRFARAYVTSAHSPCPVTLSRVSQVIACTQTQNSLCRRLPSLRHVFSSNDALLSKTETEEYEKHTSFNTLRT